MPVRPWLMLVWTGCTVATDKALDTDVAVVEATDMPVADTDTRRDTAVHTDPSTDLPEVMAPRFASGARIQVEVWAWQGLDGSLAGLHDTLLDVPCVLGVAQDGVWRCLPDRSDYDRVYADDGCREPLFFLPPQACHDSPYRSFRTPWTETCGADHRQEVFALQPVPTPAAVFDSQCLPTEAPTGQLYTVSPLVQAPVAPSTFVAFTQVDVELPGGLGVRVMQGDDGTVLPQAVFDGVGTCQAEATWDGEGACLPVERALHRDARFFGTDTCTDAPLGLDERLGACDAPRVVVLTTGSSISGVRAVAGTHGGVVHDALDSCGVEPDRGQTWITGGDAVEPDALPSLDVRLDGQGALRRRMLVREDGLALLPVPSAPFAWTSDGQPCDARLTSEGAFVCLPPRYLDMVTGVSWYRDAACTEPVIQRASGGPSLGLIQGEYACGDREARTVTRAFGLGPAWSGQLYQQLGTCVASVQSSQLGSNWVEAQEFDLTTGLPVLERELR